MVPINKSVQKILWTITQKPPEIQKVAPWSLEARGF